tara:strand:- start:116652 stop:118721 length:2070 start_codon:yes stop_codon:yes gene_type:complete
MPSATELPAPIAVKKPFTSTHHGVSLSDPYHWLKDPGYPTVEDKEILAHLEAENAFYRGYMNPHAALTTTIYDEVIGRINQDESSVPNKNGPFFYHWKFSEGAQYRTWMRRAENSDEAVVLLDEVALAEGHEFFRLGGLSVTPAHDILAWSSDTDGSERFVISIKTLATSDTEERIHADSISGTSGTVTWAADGKRFLYTLLSKEHRPYKVMMHTLGTDAADDTCIYEEADPSFFVGVGKTTSRKFITISSGDHVTTEVRILPADAPESEPIIVAPREAGQKYYLDDGPDAFLIRTNDTHKNFRIATAPLDAPGKENWQEVIAASQDHYLTGLKAFKDFFVLEERREGQEQIRIRDYQGSEHYIEFPEASFSTSLATNSEFDTQVLRVHYDSMITPPSVFDYHLADKRLEPLKVQEIPSGYDKDGYRTERLIATSHDGTSVPISVVYPKGFVKDGSQPVHLYAYGAYGIAMTPSFSAARLSLLDRGFAYAIAHIRGGDEMGYHWYEQGKLFSRTNTFHDFIACAEHLVSEGFSSKGNISISGGSAGGTLMGAVTNMRPDLWRAVVAHVPFVDVLTTMLDDSLPLTPIEWPEWGNPITDKKAYDYIQSYSPYDQVSTKNYPNLMVTAGLNDPRVTYWEPAKWVAKLRELKTNDNVLISKTNMGAGHGGKSGRFEKYLEVAEEYTFLIATV